MLGDRDKWILAHWSASLNKMATSRFNNRTHLERVTWRAIRKRQPTSFPGLHTHLHISLKTVFGGKGTQQVPAENRNNHNPYVDEVMFKVSFSSKFFGY